MSGGNDNDKALAPDGLAARLQAALGAITLDDDGPKQTYAFWGTQPVAQFGEQPSTAVRCAGRGAGLCRCRCRHCRHLPPSSPAHIFAGGRWSH